ncbi:Mg2 transporter protein CorA family protein [Methylobacterium sp. 4-46]|uniref:transporter n=1 Tax=unclassified Methylobacterium TaxID=2615210 RepID=UPI000152E88B|nr:MULTISPECIES: transporter [Methylobacterium]ACA16474.1 Mg2 transporter protein CorA family protein [Methylobacterium sp. 4-46]WFT82185.1 transporter [Methylobacterium nodulans]
MAAPAPAALPRLLCDEPALPGLLFAMIFDETGRGRLVGHDEDLPALGSFGEGFLWLHLNLVDARLDTMIAEGRLGPPRLAASALGRDAHQRIAVEGGFVGGVVADLARDGARAKVDPAGRLHVVMGPRFLVSGRRHPVVGPDATRDAAQEGLPITSPVRLLEALIGHVVGAMAKEGAALSEELDAIEDHVIEETSRVERRRLGPIRRDAVRLHRQLLGLRAVFHRFEEEGEAEGLPDREVAAAARIAQRLDSLDRDMLAMADRSRLLQEELSARLAEETNRQLFTLSVLTALFLPPTLVTGVFGMNTKGLFFAEHEAASLFALGIAGGSALAVYLVIRILGLRAPGR